MKGYCEVNICHPPETVWQCMFPPLYFPLHPIPPNGTALEAVQHNDLTIKWKKNHAICKGHGLYLTLPVQSTWTLVLILLFKLHTRGKGRIKLCSARKAFILLFTISWKAEITLVDNDMPSVDINNTCSGYILVQL